MEIGTSPPYDADFDHCGFVWRSLHFTRFEPSEAWRHHIFHTWQAATPSDEPIILG
jgi:hypothetical protein